MTDPDTALAEELLRLTRAGSTSGPGGIDTRVVILAGGRGRRLEPYTSVLPKPLMPIGNRSILEILVHQLTDAGFVNFTFCVGYLSHLIRAVLENGAKRNASITWVKEKEPLGTAGPLRLVDGLDETFLVMNGDLLTTVDYRALLRHHRESGNMLTIATHRRRVQLDYGVIHLDSENGSGRLVAFEEKPEMTWNVSMGIYAFEPRALELLPDAGAFDFPDLVRAALGAGLPVGAYVHDGLWLDIGRHEDYEQAVKLWARGEDMVEEPSGP
jgi:NDP-sugar pyrophosphorylase family protein